MEQKDPTNKKVEGHYMGMGIALGSGIGTALGTAMGNIGMGVGMGIAIGVAIGAGLEQQAKARGELRPLTTEEKQRKTKFVWIALGVALIAGCTVLYFLLNA